MPKNPGFLAFDATNGITLRLIGALLSWEEVAARNESNGRVATELSEHTLTTARIYDRILGEAQGKCYTLEDCFESHRSISLSGGPAKQTVHANRLFANVHFEPGEAAGGDRLVVQPDWLTNWISRSGVASEAILSEDPQDPQFRLTGRLVPEESVTLSDGSELILQHHMHVDSDIAGPAIRQQFAFKLKYTSVSLAEDLADVASDLQDLVSIGTGRTAAFDALTLFHPEVVMPLLIAITSCQLSS